MARYRRPVAGTVIVSDETIRLLIEAHASMAAWFYQLSGALHAAGLGAEPPSGELRRAFVVQAGAHFPELGAIATSITSPRPYLPPPVFLAAPSTSAPAADGATVPEAARITPPDTPPEPRAALAAAHEPAPIAPSATLSEPGAALAAAYEAAPVAPPPLVSPNLQESAPPAIIAQQAAPSPPAGIGPGEGRHE